MSDSTLKAAKLTIDMIQRRDDMEALFGDYSTDCADMIVQLQGQLADERAARWKAVDDYVDNNGVTCDCCQHVMIDVTAAKSGQPIHCVTGDPEGEGSGCAHGMQAELAQARNDAARLREALSRIYESCSRQLAEPSDYTWDQYAIQHSANTAEAALFGTPALAALPATAEGQHNG